MSDKYTLSVDVEATITGNVCVYQQIPNLNDYNILTLAWLSKRVHPSTQVIFEWTIDYNLTWGTQGSFGNGATFEASQTVDANLTTLNQIDFDYTDGAYNFGAPNQNPDGADNLYINQGANVRSNDALVGVGMSGAGTFVVKSQPNLRVIFHPKPTYYIVFGDFIQGQVMDITELTNSQKIVFNGTTDKALKLTSQNTWQDVS